jgi:hypothetical protein
LGACPHVPKWCWWWYGWWSSRGCINDICLPWRLLHSFKPSEVVNSTSLLRYDLLPWYIVAIYCTPCLIAA